MITGDKFQRHSFKLIFKLKFKSVRGRLLHLTFLKKRIAGSGSYEDFSIGAGAGAGAAETFYSEPEPEYFPGAGADQKWHGSASLLFRTVYYVVDGTLKCNVPSFHNIVYSEWPTPYIHTCWV